MKETIYFVMPAYNEAANINSVVSQWYTVIEQLHTQGINAILAIANDGSKDDTYDKMLDAANHREWFKPLDKTNSGHGATLMWLYNYAIDNGADYIFQTDSDGQTDPNEFWPMWEQRHDYAFQVGHRNSRQDGFSRKIVTKVLKAVVLLTFRVKVTDANTPFRLMRLKEMKAVINDVPNDFFLSNVAISAIVVKRNIKSQWLPITFKPRQGGVNSINLKRITKIGIKAIGDLYRINRLLS